ncbi:MAG: NAD(P)H-hydrate epimerase, partial [candidate division Zixibacteria bacterium]|nr:NAD(P)H-hydrate epimerase [candidate division Zixibacteria bacterium]
MKLVTAEQMRSIDRETIDNQGIPGDQLMENAGRGIADKLNSLVIDASSGDTVTVFCGKGNNGGDGFVVGRCLYQAGAKVVVYFLGPLDKLPADARLNFDRAAGVGVDMHELNSIDQLPAELDTNYIIDAIFGTGFTGAPRGQAAELIDYINIQPQCTIAIDLPSGLNADNGQHDGVAVRADYTCTLALPKYGLFVTPGRELAGAVITVPIGIPDGVVDSLDLKTDLITPDRVASLIPERKPNGHKGDFGKLFLLAGSVGMTGAAAMAAKSALRSGCGMAKVGCPHTALPLIASSVLEATTWPLPDVARKGALALRGLGEVRKLASQHDAVAVGPGVGTHHETSELIRRFVSSLEQPLVVDADGLNALVGHLDVLAKKNV